MELRVEITQLEQSAWFSIRGDVTKLNSIASALGLTRSERNKIVNSNDLLTLLPIGPRYYILQTSLHHEHSVQSQLDELVCDHRVACVNISDMHQGFEIHGENAIDVLSQLTPLNLFEFPAAHATATEIFSLPGIIWHHSEHSYRLYVERSFSEYVDRRLATCSLKA